mgnify:CR=1 FL=1
MPPEITFTHKKDLEERLHNYAVGVVKFVDQLPKDISSQIIARQLMRSGTSITANVVEAKSASSKKDYINFYTHALKSANETKFWISLIRDSGKIGSESILWSLGGKNILAETIEIANILGASIITMKKKINT